MNNNLSSIKFLAFGVILGGLMAVGVYSFWGSSEPDSVTQQDETTQPLYWVAPMDANYKRDKPGKSPMGMDLVPVYPESKSTGTSQPGSVVISPDVVNNFGVTLTQSTKQSLHNEITTVGYVQYDQDQLIHIHPRVEGWIEKLYVKAAGDPVEDGQPLYALYSPQLVNAQEEFLLALERKNSRLIEAAEARLLALQLPKSAISHLRKAKSVAQTITFYAPQSGVVDNLNIREGFFVKPGTTLMSIGKLDQVWVEAEVFERQAAQILLDLPVTMTLDYLPGKSWQGKVDYVQPIIDPQTRTIKVRLRFANSDRVLKPNMFAQVVIHAENHTPVLVVPKQALIRTGNMDRVVLALGDGRFKSVQVQTGRSDSNFVEILDGLIEGDSVVSSAQFLIDSESSKSSDFIRMSHQPEPLQNDAMNVEINDDNSASVVGTINSISLHQRKINISRGPIEKWARGPATLDFKLQDNIDINAEYLTIGAKVSFSFYIDDGEFIISSIQSMKAEPTVSPSVE